MSTVALPDVDNVGNLPPGIHDGTLEQIEGVFGRFQRTNRRCHLINRLREYVDEVRQAVSDAEVIIDGSFVMSRIDEPDDIDVVLVMPANWDMEADVRPFEYNLLSKKRVRKRFGFDVFVVRHGSPEYTQWTDFFMQVNTKWCDILSVMPGSKKGIVRIIA